MATYQTYQQVGIKEDVSDIITNISPTKTPFLSAIGTEKVTQPLFQWQEDSLRSVQGTGSAVVEGADATFITVDPTVMRTNHTQIFMEAVQVSGTADVVSVYGRAKDSAYALAKSAAALKRDLENALVGTAQANSAGNATGARTMAGVQLQVASGNVNYMGTTVALTEAGLLVGLQAAFTAGAEPDTVFVTPSNSLIVAAFASAAGRYRTLNTGTKGSQDVITNVVNLYVSPFGQTKVVIDRFLKAKNTLIIDTSMWSLATLRPWTRTSLAVTGDSSKQMIVGEFSLKHKNYSASAITVDTAASGF